MIASPRTAQTSAQNQLPTAVDQQLSSHHEGSWDQHAGNLLMQDPTKPPPISITVSLNLKDYPPYKLVPIPLPPVKQYALLPSPLPAEGVLPGQSPVLRLVPSEWHSSACRRGSVRAGRLQDHRY